jgi:hypothetical protein
MLEIRLLLQHAHNPEHREYREMWERLFNTTYTPLKQRLRRKFPNIPFEEIEDIVMNSYSLFQMQLIRKAALRDDSDIKVDFINWIEANGFAKYLFNSCNWLALHFLRTQKQIDMNVVAIDEILQLVNECEFYHEYEAATFKTFIIGKVEILLGDTLFGVFKDYALEGLKHREIAKKHNISEDMSKERKYRASRILRASNLRQVFNKYLSLKSVSIIFIIIFF